MMFKKEIYFNKIEKRKFRNSSPFKRKLMVVDSTLTNVVLNIVNSIDGFNKYIYDLNESKENIGYLIIPTLNIKYNEKLIEVFDVFILDHNLCIKKRLDNIKNIDRKEIYYNNIMLLKKNIYKILKIEVNSKINLKRIT